MSVISASFLLNLRQRAGVGVWRVYAENPGAKAPYFFKCRAVYHRAPIWAPAMFLRQRISDSALSLDSAAGSSAFYADPLIATTTAVVALGGAS